MGDPRQTTAVTCRALGRGPLPALAGALRRGVGYPTSAGSRTGSGRSCGRLRLYRNRGEPARTRPGGRSTSLLSSRCRRVGSGWLKTAMNHQDHVNLLRPGVPATGGVWADFGAGTGAFTLALAELLGP